MTTSVRYVTNTTGLNNTEVAVGSTGKDYQLLAVDLTLTTAIPANNAANIFNWTGAGKIIEIMSFFVQSSTGAIYTPNSAAATSVNIDATGKLINVAVALNGSPITANSNIAMLLVIGNY